LTTRFGRNEPIEALDNKTPNELWEKTCDRLNELKSDYNVIVMTECELKKQMMESNALKNFIEDRKKYYKLRKSCGGGINPRDAFFGGRTNCITHYAQAYEDISLEYVDFKSLYPFVLKNRPFPINHPKTIIKNFQDIRSYFGLIKCIILPPKRLYMPVLPVRVNKKLVFPICALCAKIANQESCEHSDKERALTGTWISVELIKAVELGYKIQHIIEVLHFEQTSNTLFAEYVNTFLKLKQQSEGFPIDMGEEEKLQYIQEFEEIEGILLDYEEIKKNMAKRSIAKLMLNSLWGKLAQRPNLPKTVICKDYNKRWELLNDEKLDIKDDIALSPEAALITYKLKDTEDIKPGNTSIILASFVTAHARLKLFELLEQLGRRVLYFDTDSVIYTCGPCEQPLRCGSNLGDLADEIVGNYGPGARITEFASLGPKTYCLAIRKADGSEESMIKTKGITLNKGTLKLISVKKMVEMAKMFVSGDRPELNVPQMVFRCNKRHEMYTDFLQKKFRCVSEKRRLCANGSTLPFGYVD
jgi:hypothetical protein